MCCLIFVPDYSEEYQRPPEYLLDGAKSLTMHLKSWTQRKDVSSRSHNARQLVIKHVM